MALQTSGTIKLSQLQTEFGGSYPISLGEYLRGGSYVPNTPNAGTNQAIPAIAGSAISLSKYYGTSKTTSMQYEIIGGGGGGGGGTDDGGSEQGPFSSQTGGNTTVTGTGVNLSASGGVGGLTNLSTLGSRPGLPGESSAYGAGGAGGSLNNAGGTPAATSYGAGGGGAGGDDGGYNDAGGRGGQGGFAGTRLTGSVTITYGTNISVNVGAAGTGYTPTNYDGGNGAKGYGVLRYNNLTVPFTSSGTRVID